MSPITPEPSDLPDESKSVSSGNATNSNIYVSDSDSVSDTEQNDHYGYSPLSQDPDHVFDIENNKEGYNSGSDLEDSMVPEASNFNVSFETSEARVSECSSPSTFPPMDEERIETIKSVMKGIKLPNSSLPLWASRVPEEEWKSALLATMQKRGNENHNTEMHSNIQANQCDFTDALR